MTMEKALTVTYATSGEDMIRSTTKIGHFVRHTSKRYPLIWFRGIAQGLYLPVYPVWLAAEERAEQQFVVALDADQKMDWSFDDVVDLALRRRYAERTVLVRLHQPEFRARVLHAYATRCAVCRLRHAQLLDAAHILPDSEGGEPIVTNGISMFKIHHAAFDNLIIGIRPDYRVEVRADIRNEVDGPTLRHALQEIHGSRIELPAQRAARPNVDLVLHRYERFQAAS
jgi:putative restriction endonuclease